MKKIAIDSNVIYMLSDISTNPKIDRTELTSIIENNDIYVSSIVLHEIFLHHKNSNDVMAKILNTCKKSEYDIKVFNTGDQSFKDTPVLFDIDYSSAKINKDFDLMLEDRINAEATHSVLIYSQIYFYFLLSVLSTRKNPKVYRGLSALIEVFLKTEEELAPEWINYFVVNLKDAYKTGNTDKAYKVAMNDLLFNNCKRFIDFVIRIEEGILKDNPNIDISKEYEAKLMRRERFYKLCKKHPNNICKVISEYSRNSEVNFQDFKSGTLLKFPKVTDLEINDIWYEYLLEKVEKACVRGGKIQKNDINDTLILSILDYKDFNLITFDENMMSYIERNHINSFDLISLLENQK
jgi:hypothetical protein